MNEQPIKQQTGPGDPASGFQAPETAGFSKQPASKGLVDAAEAWACLVRWREGVEAPLRARIAELEREVAALREALTPSGATKAAYSGEVKNHGASWDDYVSWSAIKDLMKLIREHAAAAIRKEAVRG